MAHDVALAGIERDNPPLLAVLPKEHALPALGRGHGGGMHSCRLDDICINGQESKYITWPPARMSLAAQDLGAEARPANTHRSA